MGLQVGGLCLVCGLGGGKSYPKGRELRTDDINCLFFSPPKKIFEVIKVCSSYFLVGGFAANVAKQLACYVR